MNRLGRLLSVITWLLVASSVVILTGGLFGRPLLMAAVPTRSMVPTLEPGDLIVVLPTWVMPNLQTGDIIVFQNEAERRWVVHRIVGGNARDGYTTQGDANLVTDQLPVFSKDIAGVVPQLDGQAMRLRRLGLLSIESGPLSSPVVAGVALIMGITLLVADVRATGKLARKRRRVELAKRHDLLISMYAALAGVAFVTTLMPAWLLSHRQPVRYEMVQQRPSNVRVAGEFLLGATVPESAVITNPSPFPMVVTLMIDDPHVQLSERWALVLPGGEHTFVMTIDNPNLGVHESQMVMGVFLPILPPQLLAELAHLGIGWAAFASALVPAVLVLIIAGLDPRFRLALSRWRYRLVS